MEIFRSVTTNNNCCYHITDKFYQYHHLNKLNYNQDLAIIDYSTCPEIDFVDYTIKCLKLLENENKKKLILADFSEAFNSIYWNMASKIISNYNYKTILIDGGLTNPYIIDQSKFEIKHITSPLFFNTLFHPNNLYTADSMYNEKTYYFLSLARLARVERIYFTNKIINDEKLKDKGLISCAWGEGTLNLWDLNHRNDYTTTILKLFLNDEDINKFPVHLGHKDNEQHLYNDEFGKCLFNIVMESSVGLNIASHEEHYSSIPLDWYRMKSDRMFFTEKSAKAFIMGQIPLFIAAPGFVNCLRKLGFDVFDDIVDHSYDKEDYIFKRCDMVYNELKRLVTLHTLNHYNKLMSQSYMKVRKTKNLKILKSLGNYDEFINKLQCIIDGDDWK